MQAAPSHRIMRRSCQSDQIFTLFQHSSRESLHYNMAQVFVRNDRRRRSAPASAHTKILYVHKEAKRARDTMHYNRDNVRERASKFVKLSLEQKKPRSSVIATRKQVQMRICLPFSIHPTYTLCYFSTLLLADTHAEGTRPDESSMR